MNNEREGKPGKTSSNLIKTRRRSRDKGKRGVGWGGERERGIVREEGEREEKGCSEAREGAGELREAT